MKIISCSSKSAITLRRCEVGVYTVATVTSLRVRLFLLLLSLHGPQEQFSPKYNWFLLMLLWQNTNYVETE